MKMKDVVNTISAITGQTEEQVHWGSAYSLWEVSRFKVTGLPVLDLFIDHVKDQDLKRLIQAGIEMDAIPHIEEIQQFMKQHNLTYPPLPARKAIDDQQIARAMLEILRLGLTHEVHAFMSTTRDNERDLFWNILTDDRKAYDKVVDLNRKKGWLMNPPNLPTN